MLFELDFVGIILIGYFREGFLTLQNAVDMAVLQSQGATLNHATLMQRYPYPPYFEDLYVIVLQTSFPDLIMVSLVLVVLNIAKSVTYEKEKRLKVQAAPTLLSNYTPNIIEKPFSTQSC